MRRVLQYFFFINSSHTFHSKQLLKTASEGIQNLPQNLNDIKKKMERNSCEANERLMARLKQRTDALQAAREEELLAQVRSMTC